MNLIAPILVLICLALHISTPAQAMVLPRLSQPADVPPMDTQTQLIQTIRQQLGQHDLRKLGAYSPFQAAVDSGLIFVRDQPMFTSEGGGQNGSYADIDKENAVLKIKFTNTWIHALSFIFCEKSAVEMHPYRAGEPDVPFIKEGMAARCIEVAAASRDLSVAQFSNFGEATPSSSDGPAIDPNDINYELVPEYRAKLKVVGGKLSMQIEHGQFAESIYIWNRAEVSSPAKWNQLQAEIFAGKLSAVASKEQGSLNTTDILDVMRDVQWANGNIPNLKINIDDARAKLSLLSHDIQHDGADMIGLIEKYQTVRANRNSYAMKNGLFEGDDLKAQKAECNRLRTANVPFAQLAQCGQKLRGLMQIISDKQRADATYQNLIEEQSSIFKPTDQILYRLIKNANNDPSILNFLIAIQPENQ